MKRPTLGSIVYDIAQKKDEKLSVIEVQRELQRDCHNELINCVLHAQKKIDCFDSCDKDYCKDRETFSGSFYIEMIPIAIPLMLDRAYRFKYIPKKACPTPNYDQNLFYYNHKSEQVEFIWAVPDKGACYHLLENAHLVVPEEKQLLDNVIAYANGTLFQIMKHRNKEVQDSPILEIKE
jgi:polyphosphate kinase